MQPVNNISRSSSEKPPVNWGFEIKHAFKIMGKVLFKFFSYFLNVLLTIMLIALITGIIVGTAMMIYIKNYVNPEIDLSLFPVGQDQTTRIYVQNSENEWVELEEERIYGSQNSIWASYQSMPKNLVNAFVCIEDKRFWDHNGIDIFRLGNAAIEFAMTFSFHSGGSTITQQLIKNITGDDEVRVQRKIEEIFRALNLEQKKSKQEILELYLNIVPLGRRNTGVQSAANYYFGKDVSQLTLIECACIAAITNNPTAYDPVRNPNGNAYRRDLVLEEMYDQGKITQAEYESAYGKEITLNITEEEMQEVTINSYFKDALIDKIIETLMEEKGYTEYAASMMLYTGGLQIYSTMDMEIQTIMEEFYKDDANFPSSGTGIEPESSMVIIDPYTGNVLGLIGGRGEKTINRGLNRATGTVRPPGSSIKPIAVYAPALDQGLITYGAVFDDVPVNFGTNPYRLVAWPKNTPAGYRGLTTIHDAITRSVNTVAVRVLQKLSLESSFDFMKNDLSIDSLIEVRELADGRTITDKDVAALALGQLNYGLTVEEITAAYAIFQNDGVFNEPRLFTKVLDSSGNVVIDNDPNTRIVISEQTASIMTIMMENVVQTGTAKCITLKSAIDCAGKTGTAGSDYDRWFVGYTPYYVGGVWFGYDMPQSLNRFSASQPPSCQIWDAIMTKIHQKYIDEAASGGTPLKRFETAAGVVEAQYCRDSGKKPTAACKLDPRGTRIETGYFTKQTVPTESCDVHVVVNYDTEIGGVALPGCSCPAVRQVALIKVTTRSFPTEVGVSDAQYVYRDLPSSVAPAGWWGVPFFQNTLSSGEYIGTSGSSTPYNRFCYTHFNFDLFNAGLLNPNRPYVEQVTTAEPEPEETTAESDIYDDDPFGGDVYIPGIDPPPTETEADTAYEDEPPETPVETDSEETTAFTPEPWDMME